MTDQTPLLLVVALAVVLLVGLRRMDAGRLLAISVFTVYLVGVASFTLLPLAFDPELARQVGPIDIARLINLRPWFLGGYFMPPDQAVLNVLLTVPFGFGLPFVAPVGWRAVIVAGFLFTVGIELAQLLLDALYLALPTWSVDTNDVILNSTGVVIGYGAFVAAALAYRSLAKRAPGVRGAAWTHFHDTLVRGLGQDRH